MFSSKKKADETKTDDVKELPEVKETAETASAEPAEQSASGTEADASALQKALDEAKAEIEKIKAELANVTDLRLRLAAEYDNFRKRSQREKDDLNAAITASSVAAMLPILDNIERALAVENASAEDMRKGVEMIYTQAQQAFEKLEVSSFGAVGDTFDPNLHHCVAAVPTEDAESGAIVLVLQKGYKLGDKIIRPAMVQVAE